MKAQRSLPRSFSGIAVLAVCLSPAYAASSGFDSVGEFSAVQGQGGWSYGYYGVSGDAATFTLMGHFNAAYPGSWSEGTAPGAPWTLLWAEGGHPNGPNSGAAHDAVRRWTSGAAGTLAVTGTYSMANLGSTALGLIVDGVSIWSSIATSNAQTLTATTSVAVGSHVDFVISSNGADLSDSTNFAVAGAVTPVPEPHPAAMLLAGLAALVLLGRCRRVA